MDNELSFFEYYPEETSKVSRPDYLFQEMTTMASGSCGEEHITNVYQKCVIPHEEKPKKTIDDKGKNCNINSITFTVDKIKLDCLPSDKSDVLEIVGGYDKNVKELKSKLNLVGPCFRHTKKTFDTRESKQTNNTDLNFNIPSTPYYKIFDNGIFFPWNAKTKEYIINANTCGVNISKTIVVYPDIEILIDIPISFSDSNKETQKLTKNKKNAQLFSEKTSESNITAKYKEDGVEFAISSSIQKKFKKIKDYQKIAENVFGTLQKAFDESIKIKFDYPVGKIHFDYKYKNRNQPFKVGSEWHIQCNIDPLIGATATLQLDEMFLKACTGPVGLLYAKIKKMLGSLNIEIKLELIVSGKIKVDSGISKELVKEIERGVKGGAGISGKIEADLKASGELKIQVIVISVEVSAEAGAKTGIEASGGLYQTSDNLGLDLNFKFLGVKLYAKIKYSSGPERKKKKIESKNKIAADDENQITYGASEWPTTLLLNGI